MGNQTNAAVTPNPDAETKLIAAQNDQFRQSICRISAMPGSIEGQLFMTPGISSEGTEFMRDAIELTGSYTAFSEDADPYGLHEMGLINP